MKTGFDTEWSSPTNPPPWICLALCTYIITSWKYFFFSRDRDHLHSLISVCFTKIPRCWRMFHFFPFLLVEQPRVLCSLPGSQSWASCSKLPFPSSSAAPASKPCQSRQLLGWGKTETDPSGSVPKAWGHWVTLHSFFPLKREVISRGDFSLPWAVLVWGRNWSP